MLIVQLGHRLSQRPNPRRRAILASMSADVHLLGPLEASLYAVVDLGRTLSQVGPLFWLLKEAMLVSLLGGPDDARGGAGGVEAGVWLVAFVRLAELSVDVRAEFWGLSVGCCARACGAERRCDWRVGGAPRNGLKGRQRSLEVLKPEFRASEAHSHQASKLNEAPSPRLDRNLQSRSSQSDVATPPPSRNKKDKSAYIPLSVGSLELENRLCENAPFRILTLSAEKDMSRTSFC